MERRKGGVWQKIKRFLVKTFKPARQHVVPSSVLAVEMDVDHGDLMLSDIMVNGSVTGKAPIATGNTHSTQSHAQPAQAAQASEREERRILFKTDQDRMANGTYPFHTRFAKEYKLRCLLGQGSFGFVFLATHHTLGNCAVKFILRDRVSEWCQDDRYGMVPKEVHLLSMVAGCGCAVIKLVDVMSDGVYVYMVTEQFGFPWSSNSTATGSPRPALVGWRGGWRMEQSPGDLFECIEAHAFLPPLTIRHIFTQLQHAVCHLHAAHGLVHRDLKDENVVVDEEYRIRLIDFGSAVSVHSPSDMAKQFHGTMAFAAPEIIRLSACSSSATTGGTTTSNEGYDPLAAEVWSLGILLYTMAMRKAPFADPWSILHADPPLPPHAADDPHGPPGMYDLIRKLLCKDPSKRIKAHAIQSHPWLAA